MITGKDMAFCLPIPFKLLPQVGVAFIYTKHLLLHSYTEKTPPVKWSGKIEFNLRNTECSEVKVDSKYQCLAALSRAFTRTF